MTDHLALAAAIQGEIDRLIPHHRGTLASDALDYWQERKDRAVELIVRGKGRDTSRQWFDDGRYHEAGEELEAIARAMGVEVPRG